MKQTETSNVFDCGLNTWLVALTSERFLLLDHAALTNSVDTQSIRHSQVQAVSISQGWVLGKLQIDLGARVIIIDNCTKSTLPVIGDLANKWLKFLEDKKNKPQSSTANATESSPIKELEKLANLYKIGALTDNEFCEAKAKLLSKL